MLADFKNLSNVEGIFEQRLTILSLEKFRKDVASADGERAEGRNLGALRPRRVLRVVQSFFEQSLYEEIVERK